MAKPAPFGLAGVSTSQLELLYRLVHRNEVTCPLSVVEIVRIGLQDDLESVLGVMRGLDANAVRSILVAVLAERRCR